MKKFLSAMTGAAAEPDEPAKTPLADLRAKRDRLKADLGAAKAESARLLGLKTAAKGDLQRAVEEGNAADRGQLVARLGKVNADLGANEALVEVTEGALAAAEAVLAEAVAGERRRLVAAAIETTEREYLDAREAIGPAFVAFAEARGRAWDLAERVTRLKSQARALGCPLRSTFSDPPVLTDAQLAVMAVEAKHGNSGRNMPAEPYFSYVVAGLAGPEPVTEPEIES